uniref:Uncharacterized protein n=1 Tax=Strombidium inclinatum TaxID=197538 RepID=A0A7S3N1H2_9SPIT|mmetsp:Transcript_39268/g.59944  ORF Transcript_39268/g.59944 Transcript_39268/m.59944 type:complete len:108 (+) Transcript_39268:49-372(+)
MSSGLAYSSFDKGMMCYVGCQEAFEWFNPSIYWCQKGCDYGRGRMSDPTLRVEADKMCQMMAQSSYALLETEDLENVEDMRIHATMYPSNASNVYRACAAGVRRQNY